MIIIKCYIQEKKIIEINYNLARAEIRDCINFFCEIDNEIIKTLIKSIRVAPINFKNDFNHFLKSYEKIIIERTGFDLKEEQELVKELEKMIKMKEGD